MFLPTTPGEEDRADSATVPPTPLLTTTEEEMVGPTPALLVMVAALKTLTMMQKGVEKLLVCEGLLATG